MEILVPGLWLRPDEPPDAGTPALLAKMLGRGEVAPSPAIGWEDAAAARLGFRPSASGRRRWLAVPVSLTAGMTDAVAQGIEDLGPEETAALLQSIRPELEAASAALSETSPGLFELELDAEGDWGMPPPSAALGRPIRTPRLEGPAAQRLQVLGNAVQMAWFSHPVNEERASRGRAPVQGLWFWSPGIPDATPAVRGIAGGGAIAAWLAAAAGVAWSADPLDRDAELAVLDAFLRAEDTGRRDQLLASLSGDLLDPRLARLRAGGAEELRVHDPGTALLRLRRSDWRRFWRRPKNLASTAPGV
ncbi:MAG: hypothetical protein EA347_03295 [Thioalkalivibrio sp.]|nr:MAG: hypothetical protein EA347_03295 [Thioalkalivibrio sp.]